jgi:hypothetical protein
MLKQIPIKAQAQPKSSKCLTCPHRGKLGWIVLCKRQGGCDQ